MKIYRKWMNKSRLDIGSAGPIVTAGLFFVSGMVIYCLSQPSTVNPFNYFEYLAAAFLDGRLYVTDTPFYFEELVNLGGRSYVIYPPLPALLLIPFVMLRGISSNQLLLSFILGGFNISLVYLTLRKLTENEELRIWMTVLFGFGTIHWYTASIGSVWYLAQVTSLFFLMAAVYTTLAGRSPFVAGLLLGASYMSRLTTILTLPFFVIMLLRPGDSGEKGPRHWARRLWPVVLLSAGVGIFVLLNCLYNYLRFGSPFDVAYELHTISAAKAEVSPWFNKGLFSLSYIPHHIYAFLLQPPEFIDKPPYVIPCMSGLSLFITTPAFIFAFLAGLKSRIALACWAAILPTAFLIFIKSGSGWMQFGYRYALDFYPFLLLLTLEGIGPRLRWYHKTLIALSVLVNLWGVLFINKFDWYKLY